MIDMDYKPRKFHRRRFLNKEGFHSVAAIDISFHDPKEYGYSEINISDCSRVICLTLDMANKEDIDNAFFKLQAIIDTCQEAKEYLAENEHLYIEEFKRKELERSKENNKDEQV